MKNFVQPGGTITLAAPYAVTSGSGLLVGSIFGVALATVSTIGDPVEALLEGVVDIKKTASQAWSQGDRVYWDNTAKEVTKTAAGNTAVGVAVDAVDASATSVIGRVRLNGAF
jgi:predicted RecA/RadA family phage recombinase